MRKTNERPGLSAEKYAELTDREKEIFDLIVSRPSGMNKDELKKETNLPYEYIKMVVDQLIRKGVAINVYNVGGMYWSFVYSVYAEDYDKWIKK